ncbi:hypothetical protein [Streptomyces scabiei]|uniref:hypothetical protein n=1 Tax=Streptomyces scabiei TaxID=1930 RepID=UPI0018FEC93B|nr:hypothetical protein [Streptomyces scabiei]
MSMLLRARVCTRVARSSGLWIRSVPMSLWVWPRAWSTWPLMTLAASMPQTTRTSE